MKTFSLKFLVFVCFVLVFLAAGTPFSLKAQEASEKSARNDKPAKKSLAEIVRAKKSTAPFVLLTPSDLSGLSIGSLTADDPCETAMPISVGEVKNGNLNQSDCALDDNSYADFYYFNGNQGQQVPIYLSSTAFDTYLGIANESGSYVVEDDDGAGGTNSKIIATLPETGVYLILANSALPYQFGEYTLSLNAAPYCTYSISPTSADVSPSGGTYNFSVSTQAGCGWQAYVPSYPYFIQTSSRGIGSGTVEYTVDPNGPTSRNGTITLVPGYSPAPTQNLTFTVNQAPLICSYSLSSSSIQISGDEYYGSFNITAPAGCYWQAQPNDWFVSTNSYGRGNGTINYVVGANNGADRSGTITVAGKTFAFSQSGYNCTYSVSPGSITVDRQRQSGTITVNTQPNCTWSIYAGSWVYASQSGRGSGSAIFNVYENFSTANRSEYIYFNVSGANGSKTIQILQTAVISRKAKFDYDGDGKTDMGIFRPSVGEWWINRSGTNVTTAGQFGTISDKPVSGDFTGDGKADVSFFRPSTGEWFVLRSEDSSYFSFPFGSNGDIPAPADYDGDGKADAAVFRPSTNIWYISKSSGGTIITSFGIAEDKPVVADYDGDGKADIAIFRPSVGEWWYQRSSDNQVSATQFGQSTDKAVPGDYTGDGKADIAFWRPSTGEWFVLKSENTGYYAVPFGTNGDVPAPGDYDGDGKFDTAVFRPSTNIWYLNQTTAGISIVSFGLNGDRPVASVFIP